MKKFFAVSLGLAVLVLAGRLCAQDQLPILEVKTADGRTTFHIGERIPLQLTFTSPNDTQYVINNWGFGRDSEMRFESFSVGTATGWVDPLATYYVHVFYGGSAVPIAVPFLTSKPLEGSVDLNEWVRFDLPGVYTVTAKSHRVQDAVYNGHERSPLESKPIVLTIIPATPDWQNETLEHGTEADLRYLATPGSVAKMVEQLREDRYGGLCRLGILGLPDALRGLAIELMRQQRLGDPNYPITVMFYDTMLLAGLNPTPDEKSYNAQQSAASFKLLQDVLDAAGKKNEQPRLRTAQMLVQYQMNMRTLAQRQQMGAFLRETFPEMDSGVQIGALRLHWDQLRSPGILPELRKLAMLPAANDDNLGPGSRANLKSIALRHWYELDPAAAKKEIFAQIDSDDPQLPASAISFLPVEPIPQFEVKWARGFNATTNQLKERVLGSLLVRFGTGAVNAGMVSKMSGTQRSHSCDPDIYVLAYLSRFDPVQARPLLERELTPNQLGCSGSMFQWVSQQAVAPVLNDLALEALDNPNPHVVQSALQYLRLFGRAADKGPIWEHYVQWSRKWAGKADQLDSKGAFSECKDKPLYEPMPAGTPAACAEAFEARQLGDGLAFTLVSDSGWFADDAFMTRVSGMCVGEMACRQLKNAMNAGKAPYRVILPDQSRPLGISATEFFSVGQYQMTSLDELVKKIEQYPAGSQFGGAFAPVFRNYLA